MNDDVFAGIPVLLEARPDRNRSGLLRDLYLIPEGIVPAVERLFAAGYHLEDISGLDTKDGILVSYHFDHFEKPGRIALRVLSPHDTPKVPSIANIFDGAQWHERELSDFYGVVFEGNPNPTPLLLPATDVTTPLRKAEASRVSLGDLIDPGEIVQMDPRFDYFAPKDNTDAESKEAEA